jgi:hypothetical protein
MVPALPLGDCYTAEAVIPVFEWTWSMYCGFTPDHDSFSVHILKPMSKVFLPTSTTLGNADSKTANLPT